MKNISFFLVLIIGISCSKNDPIPTEKSIFGTWQMVNNGISVTIEIDKNHGYQETDLTSTIYHNPKVSVTYLGVTKYSDPNDLNTTMYKEDGKYNFYFWTMLECIPFCGSNAGRITGCSANSTFTEMTAIAGAQNTSTNGNWISVWGFDGTTVQNTIQLQEPIILKKIKGPN
jgi:hypothetical protein